MSKHRQEASAEKLHDRTQHSEQPKKTSKNNRLKIANFLFKLLTRDKKQHNEKTAAALPEKEDHGGYICIFFDTTPKALSKLPYWLGCRNRLNAG